MGPRPFGRGMTPPALRLCPKGSFNGAATFRSRNVVFEPAGCRKHEASMGPRPFGRGMPAGPDGRPPPKLLQWGRDLSVAEWAPWRPAPARENSLQWGRDLSVAEWRSFCRTCSLFGRFNGAATFRSRNAIQASSLSLMSVMLQWGRDLSVAECRQLGGFWADFWRFNGAATFRSRNVALYWRAVPSQCCRFNGAATFRSRNARYSRRPARATSPLQWGRDLSVAECCSRGITAAASCGFNGAATFRSRNGLRRRDRSELYIRFNGAATFRSRNDYTKNIEDIVRRASMGPRPFGRGMAERLECDPDHGRASMGPRPFGRGMRRRSLDARGVVAASMGPRPFGRGMPLARTWRVERSVLQWGRDLSVAEWSIMLSIGVAILRLQWGRDLSVAE